LLAGIDFIAAGGSPLPAALTTRTMLDTRACFVISKIDQNAD
jgi:hypothetical protein